MKQRQYDQIAATISIVLLAGLAGTSFYLAELSRQFRSPTASGTSIHEPDYFVENLSLTRLDRAGNPAFRMSAEHMLHFPDDDSSEFVHPQLVSLDPGKPLVTLRSDRGRATSGGDEIHLHDNVRLVRAAHGDDPRLQVDTEFALVLPEQNIARTDHPVRIQWGASTLTGVGMEFDNSARVLKVHSKVHGVWAAPGQQ